MQITATANHYACEQQPQINMCVYAAVSAIVIAASVIVEM